MPQALAASARARRSLHLALLLALPVLLTVVLPDWIYTNMGAVDAWIYHGFFRHTTAYTSTLFPDTYYGTRLAWIVPGHLAYRLFSPVVANAVLHVTFYGVAVVAMYAIVRELAAASIALFTAVAFGLYLPLVRSMGDDYIDTAVIAYALLASLALIRATRVPASRWSGVLAGMATGAMFHSNVGTAFLLPSVLIWIVPFSRDRAEWRRMAGVVWYWCLGGLLITGLLALFSVTHGGTWLFFMPSFTWLGGMSSNPWDVTGLAWVWGAPFTFMPFALALGAIVMLFVPGRRAGMTPPQARALAGFLLTYLVTFLWDNVGPGNALSLSYYVSWLYPSAFVLIGGAFLGTAPRQGLRDAVVLALAVALVTSLGLTAFDFDEYRKGGLIVCVLLAVLAALMRSSTTTAVAITALLAVIHGEVPNFRAVPAQADQFRVADRGMRFTDRFANGRAPRFLLADNASLFPYMKSVASIYLWEYSVASMDFPRVSPEQAATMLPGTVVVLMTGDRATGETFDAVFAPYGLTGTPLGSDHVATPAGELFFTAVEAVATPRHGAGRSGDAAPRAGAPTPDDGASLAARRAGAS